MKFKIYVSLNTKKKLGVLQSECIGLSGYDVFFLGLHLNIIFVIDQSASYFLD